MTYKKDTAGSTSENLRETRYNKSIETPVILNIFDAVKKSSINGNVIVTGVTGQDGSHMVDYLLKNTNFAIFGGVRRLSVYNHENINHIRSDRFHLINFDLTDSHAISRTVEELKPRYFINFAAQSYVASSWDFAKHTWETNSTAVLDILEAIRIHCHSCRFYNAGSSEEFGNVQYSPQDELHPARPRSPYGASKTAARQLVKVYRESYDLYAVQGWLFNHEGERRGEEFVTKKIAKNVVRIKNALLKRERFLPMELGNLDAKRDWSYAPDLIEGVWRMLNQDVYRSDVEDMISSFDKSGKLMLPRDINPTWHSIVVKNLKDYVLGSGENHTIREFVESAFNAVGIVGTWVKTGDELTEQFVLVSNNVNHTIPLVTINPKFYRPAEVDTLLANPILAKTDLNWKTKTSFDDLIKIMVDSENRKQSV